jgi:hypothetical protein
MTSSNWSYPLNKTLTVYLLILFSGLAVSGSAFAHGGGVDDNGCHSKKGVRHCHGEKAGLYIPEKEETRIKKLHTATCNQQSPEGYFPKRDLYGKRCNAR